jgi:flagellar hook-associated protein 2
MSRVTTGVGIYSGLNIDDIVTKLMDIEKQPVKDLQTRIDSINSNKAIFANLSALILKLKLDTQTMFSDGNVFTSRQVASSNEGALTATAARGAALGSYSFTVKSLVQSHQMMSTGYSGTDTTIGAGTISLEMGNGNLDRETSLDALNGGRGVAGGSIAITDRSGRSAVVDLSGATTVSDVLDAINTTTGIGVRASVSGDRIVIADTTGATASDLAVEEAGGTTAADLGILGSSSSPTVTGADIVAIGRNTSLDSLNDARGVRTIAGLADVNITRRDGTSFTLSLGNAQTVGAVLDAINNNAANADGKLVASVSADGKGITLTDSTGGAGSLTVEAQNGSLAAADLGLIGSVAGNELDGKRIVGGLNSVLLASLNGGSGVAAGSIRITNHAGASAVVVLTGAATISDVISAINSSGMTVTASYNASRTGIVLADASTGSTAFSVADVDSTTAADLKIAASAAGSTINGSNLQLQYVSERTQLATLNGGKGIFKGSFRITDRSGNVATVDVSKISDVRIEDVISNINTRGIGVRASINSTGDGILLTDTTGGSGALKVDEIDGSTAADLGIKGSAAATDPTHIDGSYEKHITILATDTLQQIAAKISSSGAPVTAKVVSDGSSVSPYHLSLTSKVSGAAGRMIVDTGGLDMSLFTTQTARDAVVLYGQEAPGSHGMLVRNSSNTISGIVDGLTLNLQGVSDSPVTISVTSDDDTIVKSVSGFVDDWNSTIDKIQSSTSYDASTQTAGQLLGDSDVMRIEDQLNGFVSYSVDGASARYNRLSRIGVTFLETGKLSFDETKLRAALGDDRSSVEQLFTMKDSGLGAHFSTVLDNLTDQYSGLIKQKDDSYDSQIEVFQSHIDSLGDRLAKEQERLYNEFYAMETALASLDSQKTAIANMTNINLFNTTGSKSSSSSS